MPERVIIRFCLLSIIKKCFGKEGDNAKENVTKDFIFKCSNLHFDMTDPEIVEIFEIVLRRIFDIFLGSAGADMVVSTF